MADIKISALPGASTLTGAETIPLVQGGTTKKVTTDQFLIKDASGNVGLGVTPSAWGGGFKATQVTAGASLASNGANSLILGQNWYYNGTNDLYIGTYAASIYQQLNGTHKWFTAPSGTAGNPISFTQATTLDASGNLGLGVTPGAWYASSDAIQVGLCSSFYANGNTATAEIGCNVRQSAASTWNYIVNASGASRYEQNFGSHNWYSAGAGTAGDPVTFTTTLNLAASGHLTPGGDNTQTLGSGAKRWSTVYAGTGTINTSDAREKTDVRVMAADEIEAAKALSKEIGIYQFLDSVAKKGDKARHHVGLTVQRAIELMKLHGLDPFAYGFICFDKWDDVVVEHPAVEAKAATEAKDEVVDAEGNVIEAAVEAQAAIEAKDAWAEVTLKAGDRYSFRYDQLNLFIARGIEARLAALEAK